MSFIEHSSAGLNMKNKDAETVEGKLLNGMLVFTRPQILKIFDIKKPERFRQWLKLNYIKPHFEASGSGTLNYFTKYNLYTIGLFKKLIDLGLNRWVSMKLSHEFDDMDWHEINYDVPNRPTYMFAYGKVDRAKNWEDVMKVRYTTNVKLQDVEAAIVVNLSEIKKSIDKKIGRIAGGY